MTSIFGGGQTVNVNVNGTLVPESFTATAGQTVFNITNFTYTPGTNSLLVFLNSGKQVIDKDYSETSSSSFTLVEACLGGETVEVIGFPEVNLTAVNAGSVNIGGTYSLQNLLADSWINVKSYPFLAKGDNTETLYSTNYIPQIPYTITQQTFDALAINKAIKYLRSIGGGTLYIPKGVYKIYGYLEPIDFPCKIVGDGLGITVIKNCASSPTNANAYGCFIVSPSSVVDVTIEDLTIDGNAESRVKPTGEFGSYPLAIYGSVKVKLVNVEIVNSPIDCLLTSYDNTTESSLLAVNVRLSNSYRNTLSCVAGWNQSWTNCIIEGGGKVHTGTAPSYCLDIEPNLPTETIKNITFSNCLFRDARGVIAGGVWAGNVKFDSCTFDCYGGTGVQPWAASFYCGQFTFNNCTFKDDTNYLRYFCCNGTGTVGEYLNTQFVAIKNCIFEGVGFQGFGPDMTLENTRFLNSLYPVRITGSGVQSATIRNVTLINVFDSNNYGGGTYASFSLPSDVEGYVDIDGLHVRVEPQMLPASPSFAIPSVAVTGIYILPSASSKGVKVSNVHIAGYYQKYPNNYGYTLGANYRDWGQPNVAPADTAGNTVAPGATPFWRNCTMHGNNA